MAKAAHELTVHLARRIHQLTLHPEEFERCSDWECVRHREALARISRA